MSRLLPFGEESSGGIQQEEELFLSLGAVSCVQAVLQWHRPLHCTDHVNRPLLDTPGRYGGQGEGYRDITMSGARENKESPINEFHSSSNELFRFFIR